MAKSYTYFALLVLILAIVLVEILNSFKPKHPDAGLNIVTKLVQKYGYPIETHDVYTSDDYILTLHRISHGRKKSRHRRIPVLFMHGFSQSATDFINLGPDKALSFLLADKGYDVWLGNARGTTWSRRHKILDPDKDKQFWNYSLHEIGIYDTSAFIDYILKTTREKSLHYIGFSQGTIVFFILASELPQYTAKVKLMTALAPAIFLKESKCFFSEIIVPLRRTILTFCELFNINEIFSKNGLIARYLTYICNENSIFVDLCLHHIFLIQGYSPNETNKSMLSLIYSNTPAGASAKQMVHIFQLMSSGNFEQFDLGSEENLKTYGHKEAPHYNLSRVNTPVALYYSSNDWTVNINNIDKVVSSLPNVVKRYQVPLDTFNHNDFVQATNAVPLLYNAVLDEILKY